MDRFNLNYYYRRSREPNTLAIVLENNGQVSAVSLLIIGRNSISVEMLAKNRYVAHPGAGVEMLACIEEHLAGQLNVDYVTLDAIDRKKLIQFYLNRGFVKIGNPVHDRQWGILHPMGKRITRVEN